MLVSTPKVVVIFLVRLAALVQCSHYFNSNFFFSFGNPISMTALGGICGILTEESLLVYRVGNRDTENVSSKHFPLKDPKGSFELNKARKIEVGI